MAMGWEVSQGGVIWARAVRSESWGRLCGSQLTSEVGGVTPSSGRGTQTEGQGSLGWGQQGCGGRSQGGGSR